jgi:hypothetical protein
MKGKELNINFNSVVDPHRFCRTWTCKDPDLLPDPEPYESASFCRIRTRIDPYNFAIFGPAWIRIIYPNLDPRHR